MRDCNATRFFLERNGYSKGKGFVVLSIKRERELDSVYTIVQLASHERFGKGRCGCSTAAGAVKPAYKPTITSSIAAVQLVL